MTRTTFARAAGVCLAAGAVLSAAACSGPAGGGPSGGASDGGGTVGIVEFDTTSAIDSLFVDGARSALEDRGYDVVSQDPKGDPGQANTICTQYVTRQVAAIVVTTFALDQMAQCMSQARGAEIPVFYIGSPLLDGMAGSVDVTSPAPINDLFIEYLEAEGVTDILTLDYTPGTPCRIRKEYRDEKLADLDVNASNHEFPIPGQVVDAQNATAAWLAAHPEGSGTFAIWACFTDPTAGAVAAMNQAGRTDIPVYTWDFNSTILDPIKAGQVAATLSLDGAAVGAQVVDLIDDVLAGGEPQGVPASNTVLTRDTIDAFLAENPDALD
ncbi:substrate-binding domain-containing protein [Microcella daejeonensis]|uniref:substrate-binding domain-containing protein n=1 Tax=Microcella daejeonensis TaxID=2994971 RepID=UPI00226F026A|nr:substrate-binding domain-containing protein [Microcella daejeonensis]WAB84695.1 substrate-binding domain-containing protein [Microcella daejeonensis]